MIRPLQMNPFIGFSGTSNAPKAAGQIRQSRPTLFEGQKTDAFKKTTEKSLFSRLGWLAVIPAVIAPFATTSRPIAQLQGAEPVKKVTAEAEKPPEEKVVEVTDANFEAEVLKSDIPVLLKYGAKWCGPCLKMEPELKKLANAKNADGTLKYKGKMKVAHIDIDQSPKTAEKYDIASIPDTRIFKKINKDDKQNKDIPDTKIGFHTKEQLETWADKNAF